MRTIRRTRLVDKFQPQDAHLFKPPLLADAWFYEILRKARFYIERQGAGNSQRFARIFRKPWLFIPAEYRRKLLDSWRPGYAGSPWVPMINLTPDYHLV
jgi:hypothetical protein